MDINRIKLNVQAMLSNERYLHTLRVMDESVKLAKQYGLAPEQAKLAALLHDYAKCLPVEVLKAEINTYKLPSDLLSYHHELWHGPVAAEIARREYNVNADIYNAIYYHTTAREGMSLLELIIFVADYIEPARDFEGVAEVRKLAEIDLEQAAQKAIQNTVIYLMRKNASVYPDSFHAYNGLTNKLRRSK